MIKLRQYLVIFIFLFLLGCQEDDVFLHELSEVIENTNESEWRKKQNAWIYAQMKHNYFWTDQLMDSTDYDYLLEPSEFFKSMIVPEDRFSYCRRYDGYRPQVKGHDLNETVSLDSVYCIGNKRVGYFVYDEFDTEEWSEDDSSLDINYDDSSDTETYLDDDDYSYQETEKYGARTSDELADMQ